MKKNYIILLLAGAAFLPVSLKAQQSTKAFNEQYRQQIKENAALEAKTTAAFMRKKYSADVETEKSLYKMYYDHKLAVEATIEKYAKSPELNIRLATVIAKNDSIADLYLQAVKTRSLYKNKTLKPNDNSKFAAGVRLRKELGLSAKQIDSLMFHANTLNELLANDAGFNAKDYERKVLPGILNDEQYLKLLRNGCRETAVRWAQSDWKELTDRGLSVGMDSLSVIKSIVNYNMAKLVIKARYGDNIPPNSVLKSIESPMPEALQKLKTARKYNNPIPEKTAQSNFTW